MTMQDEPFEQSTPSKTKPLDTLTTIARRKLQLSDVYTCCGWTRVDPYGLLVRMKEEYIKSSGKNKGKPGWKGEERTCFVTYKKAGHAFSTLKHERRYSSPLGTKPRNHHATDASPGRRNPMNSWEDVNVSQYAKYGADQFDYQHDQQEA